MTLLARGPLRPQRLVAAVCGPKRGGLVLFAGAVRGDRRRGLEVTAISYDACRPLADKTLASILREAGRRWKVRAAARHRLGRVPTGAAAFAVAVASGHRAEAFAACRYVVEQAKKRLPVWKKEHYSNGSSKWLSGRRLR